MWIKIIVTALFVLLFVIPQTFLAFGRRPVRIVGEAMAPHYKNGQYYIANVLGENEAISRGDVVIFNSSATSNADFIKRVVGMPNERVMVKDGKVYINGQVLNESGYLDPTMTTTAFENGVVIEGEEMTIPADHYFMLGDNRAKSTDSREFGFISRSDIKSKVAFCYWGCK
jgi:signal peptidase I